MAGSYKNRCKMLDSKTCGGNTVKIVVNTRSPGACYALLQYLLGLLAQVTCID